MFENRGGLWVLKPNRRLLLALNFAMVLLSLVQASWALTDRPVRAFPVILACVQAVFWAIWAANNLKLASREAKASANAAASGEL